MPQKNSAPSLSYVEAIRSKNAARSQQRKLVLSGVVSPREAQKRSSLFHGVKVRVISHGQGAAV